MSDMQRDPTRKRYRDRPRHELERGKTELDEFWQKEADRREKRNYSWLKLTLGGAGGLSTLVLMAQMGSNFDPLMSIISGTLAGAACGVTALGGVKGLWDSRPVRIPLNASHRRSIAPDTRILERVVLEVIEDHGEVTPARVALETSCTVEEAEEILSRLAEKGHLDVRVDGGRLVYSL